MRLVATCAAAAAAAVACGDNDLPQSHERSGSRIRAMYQVDAEGDRLFHGWYDQTLDRECVWSAGGDPRCLPAFEETAVFLDAQCQQPALERARAVPPQTEPPLPAYLGVRRSPCAERPLLELSALTGAVVAPLFVWSLDASAGTCRGRAADYVTYAYYPTGEPLPPETFVGGEVANLGGGRIRTRTVVGDDGSLAPIEAFDTELGASCEPDLERGCVPAAAYASIAEDAACLRPIAAALNRCEPPAVIAHTRSDTVRLYRRGDVFTDDPEEVVTIFDMSVFITGQGWSCTERQAQVIAGRTLYRAGAEISVDRLAQVADRTGEGRRLRPQWLQAGGHRAVYGYLDVAEGTTCSPTEVVPGVWHCLPDLRGIWRDFFYANATCSEPLALGFDYGEHTPVIETVRNDDGTWRPRLYELGLERAPGTYFWTSDEGCVPYSDGEFTAHELGAEVSIDRYAPLALVTE